RRIERVAFAHRQIGANGRRLDALVAGHGDRADVTALGNLGRDAHRHTANQQRANPYSTQEGREPGWLKPAAPPPPGRCCRSGKPHNPDLSTSAKCPTELVN